VKLTSTNRPFGLIIKLSQAVDWLQAVADQERAGQCKYAVRSASSRTCNASQILLSRSPFARGVQVSGDQTARVTPVPIPNTEVKPRRADDTARVTVWERRSSPGLYPRPVRQASDRPLFLLGSGVRRRGVRALCYRRPPSTRASISTPSGIHSFLGELYLKCKLRWVRLWLA
jgi:hypothetical protein